MKLRWSLALLASALLGALAWWRPHPVAPPAATTRPPPAAAHPLTAALEISDPRQRAQEFGRAFQLLIDRDSDAALAALRQLRPGADYDLGLLLLLDTLVRRDAERALAVARGLVTTREQSAIYSSFFDQFARENPLNAVQRLALVPAGPGRENALRALASAWVRSDAPAALAWAQRLPTADRAPALESALTELALKDPLQTIQLAAQSLTGTALERTVFRAFQKIAASDPTAAAGLVSLLPPGELQTRAAVGVARALAEKNPPAALTFVQTLPAGSAQRLALNHALTGWATNDSLAAGQHVAGMPPGPAQDAAVSHLATLLAAQPPAARAWAQTLTAESARSAALISIASAWAQQDPAAATRWAGWQPPSPAAATALTGALSYWVLQDAAAARDFVGTLPAAPQAIAAASIAPPLAQANPTATLGWAQSLSAPVARDAAVSAAYARWLDNAPAAARAWLATANLSSALKAKLLESPPP